MRTRLIALTALLAGTALVAGSAAESATTTKRYLRFTGVALFSYSLDYGKHPDSVYNGTFSAQGYVNVRAIVVYDGRGVYVPKGAMIVDSSFSVDNQMTQWNGRGAPRIRLTCPQPERASPFKLSNGSISVSRTGLSVSPGNAVVSAPACNATESMVHHGLSSGPSFTLPAPARSRFNGKAPFSISCEDSFEHGPEGGLGGGVDAHVFRGFVFLYAKLTPFPQRALASTKRSLRNAIGTSPESTSIDAGAQDCL